MVLQVVNRVLLGGYYGLIGKRNAKTFGKKIIWNWNRTLIGTENTYN